MKIILTFFQLLPQNAFKLQLESQPGATVTPRFQAVHPLKDVPLKSTEPSLRPQTLIIADDLTGACDAAAAFSNKGTSTQVLLHAEPTSSRLFEVTAVCTESRDMPAEQAVRTILRVAETLDSERYDRIFKKIDSTFRGNTFREIQATLDAFKDYCAIVAPAYPALGRTVAGGMLTIRDIVGETTIPLREKLEEMGLRFPWISAGQNTQQIKQQMLQSLRSGSRAIFCDAVTNDDLQATVWAAKAIPQKILWIGSAGLAHALTAELPTKPLQRKLLTGGKILLFVGSNHPVTQKQVSALREQHAFLMPSGGVIDRGAKDDATIFLRIERDQTTEEEIRVAVSNCASQTVSCLFMTGGDTAMLVCRALGIRSLRLHEEFEPGVPQGIATGGSFEGCTVILKSGGFGRTDLLNRVVKHFSQKKEDVL
jgi:uncharacterized protein YgbK (DUF1537 family)